MSLDNLWSSKRRTRRQAKEETEGRKRYFDNRIDADIVLGTWFETTCTGNIDYNGNDLHEEE
jgi:hypothetical protein